MRAIIAYLTAKPGMEAKFKEAMVAQAQRCLANEPGCLQFDVTQDPKKPERFVMRAASVEYHAPARFDDLLEVFVRVRRIGRSSLTAAYAAYGIDGDRLMCTAEQTFVYVDAQTERPVRVPDAYRAPIRGFEGADLEEAG